MSTAVVYDQAVGAVLAAGGKKTRLPDAKPAPQRKVTGGRKLPHPAKAKDEAVRAVTGKQPKKPAARKRSTGNGSGPVQRLSNEWPSSKGKDVAVKDLVRMADGTVIEVIGRWTKRLKDGALQPMVTGHIVRFPAGATASVEGKGKKVGDRQNAVAAECTHTK